MDFWFWSVLKSFIREKAPQNLDQGDFKILNSDWSINLLRIKNPSKLKSVLEDYFTNIYDHKKTLKTIEL